MSVIKVIELLAQSETGWEDAARQALAEASKTIHGIKTLYVQDMQAVVEDGKITQFRLNAKVSFLVEEGRTTSTNPGRKDR
jgi:flavin-binding protein dodecin